MKPLRTVLSIVAVVLVLAACGAPATPSALEVAPGVSRVTPSALEVAPGVSPATPSALEVAPGVSRVTPPKATAPASLKVAAGQLPLVSAKPEPKEITYQGCPPEGDGGDPQLNRLKNRVDTGQYVAVDFDTVEKLPWPKGIERRDRDNWSTADAAAVAKYEGIPISIEGYLYGAKESGPESTNCHGTANDQVDWHVWLTKAAGEDRTNSIVVETTPRVRKDHPGWTLKAAEKIAKDQTRVRISGWLMLDPEHPDQVSKTRGTIWEIHPVMQIEVQQGQEWIPLDK